LLRHDTLERLKGALEAQPHAVSVAGACRIFHDDERLSAALSPGTSLHARYVERISVRLLGQLRQNLHRTSIVRELNGFDSTLRNVHDRDLWLQARPAPGQSVSCRVWR
jgi:hypothetical protein